MERPAKRGPDDSSRYEILTKLQAAQRQLRVAIRLFFERRDLVAVHTLGTAAQGMLRDLGLPRGIKGVKDGDFIRPERKKDLETIFNEAQNFFKHADRDPDKELKFYYGATPFYLLDAAILYIQLTGGRQFPELTGLLAWSIAKYPDLLIEGPFKQQILALRSGINPDDFELLLEAIDSGGLT